MAGICAIWRVCDPHVRENRYHEHYPKGCLLMFAIRTRCQPRTQFHEWVHADLAIQVVSPRTIPSKFCAGPSSSRNSESPNLLGPACRSVRRGRTARDSNQGSGGRHIAAKSDDQTDGPILNLLRATMTSRPHTTPQHYAIETEPQATPRVRENVRRMVDARDEPSAPQFDAAALTAALSLDAKPALGGVARKVAATYAIPYDSLMARRHRANSAA